MVIYRKGNRLLIAVDVHGIMIARILNNVDIHIPDRGLNLGFNLTVCKPGEIRRNLVSRRTVFGYILRPVPLARCKLIDEIDILYHFLTRIFITGDKRISCFLIILKIDRFQIRNYFFSYLLSTRTGYYT